MRKIILYILILFLVSCQSSEKKFNKFSNSSFVTSKKASELNKYFSYFHKEKLIHSFKINYKLLSKNDNKYNIEISFLKDNYRIKTKIELIGSILSLNEKLFVEINEGIGFISWISEPGYHTKSENSNHKYELHLKIIDLDSGKEYYKGIIYSTKFSISRLAVKYNSFTKSLLYVFNDFSLPDDKYLVYDALKIANNKPLKNQLSPKEIIKQDNSEKRHPKFISGKKDIYLYHTTGDRWGFFEHSGKSNIGISRINKYNSPVEYKVIIDSLAIHPKLVLINDTIFFEVRVEFRNKPDKMKIKKIALKDLDEY